VFTGHHELSADQLRVLGCLLEKQLTTPDIYPLTLNALRAACNQSTNRDPVVDYDDGVIRDALHRLERRSLIRLASGRGSRAPKYRHLLAEALPMSPPEQAIVCVLMLRGAQTPGELKQRTERMHPFASLDSVHETLDGLIGRDLVVRLQRRPGQKEERYAQLLAAKGSSGGDGTLYPTDTSGPEPAAAAPGDSTQVGPRPGRPEIEELRALGERVAALEREVAQLRASVQAGAEPRGHAEVLT
jgi:uncharacterized protein YceH (UPF0502 family)